MERKEEQGPILEMAFTDSVLAYYRLLVPDNFERLDAHHATIQIGKISDLFRSKIWDKHDVLTEGRNLPYDILLSVRPYHTDNTGHVGFTWLGEYQGTSNEVRTAKCKNVDLVYLIMNPVFNIPDNDLMRKLVDWGAKHGEDTKMQEAPWGHVFRIDQNLYEPLKDAVIKPHQFVWVINQSLIPMQDG